MFYNMFQKFEYNLIFLHDIPTNLKVFTISMLNLVNYKKKKKKKKILT
ncbi:hypothetical protein ACJIZ3_003547 [Penstemon smallii]|uniref:Uncharacterized protein n=1 Tax=Penstemon smallii TaxID=265156 RepID=A0ABD3U9I2_9LAMI